MSNDLIDKELADKVVEYGIGELGLLNHKGLYFIPGPRCLGVTAEYFVRDWRVAGALMEKCKNDVWRIQDQDTEWAVGRIIDYDEVTDCDAFNESLPRAIIEACAKELVPDGCAVRNTSRYR